MPATKLAAKLKERETLDFTVRKYLFAHHETVKSCAKKISVSFKTLYVRLDNPDDFHVSELRKVRKALNIPADEFMEALRPWIE